MADGDQARHAAAALIFRAHGVAGALRRDHQHVEIGARIDQVEVHVQAVREQQRRALLHVGVQMIAIDVALQLVGRQHHHHVRPLRGLGDFHHLEARAFRLLRRGRALAQRNRHVLDAGILQVQRMGVALAAIADDADLLALDQVQVGIAIVINTHDQSLCFGGLPRPASGLGIFGYAGLARIAVSALSVEHFVKHAKHHQPSNSTG